MEVPKSTATRVVQIGNQASHFILTTRSLSYLDANPTYSCSVLSGVYTAILTLFCLQYFRDYHYPILNCHCQCSIGTVPTQPACKLYHLK